MKKHKVYGLKKLNMKRKNVVINALSNQVSISIRKSYQTDSKILKSKLTNVYTKRVWQKWRQWTSVPIWKL